METNTIITWIICFIINILCSIVIIKYEDAPNDTLVFKICTWSFFSLIPFLVLFLIPISISVFLEAKRNNFIKLSSLDNGKLKICTKEHPMPNNGYTPNWEHPDFEHHECLGILGFVHHWHHCRCNICGHRFTKIIN